MNTTMRFLMVVALVATLLNCAGATRTGTSSESAIPEEQVGLGQDSVFGTPTPAPVVPNVSDPGEQTPVPAAFDGSPPVIPHTVVDFVPITADNNMCVECHALDEAGEGDPTPIPESHYTDMRNDPGKVTDEVVGARYRCTACHAPQTDAAPLVENRFGK
jgi:nitrate reductase cytochrome c-type subunit